MIGRKRLQPDDPPPNLAIETDVTSKTTLDAYEAIQVPELWIYDGGKLTIFLLTDYRYTKSEISSIFTEIPILEMIPATIKRSWQLGSLHALEEFESALTLLQSN